MAAVPGNDSSVQQPFQPYHQLATFAPSKGDILNTLEFFFGKPAQPEKLNDFSEHHAATYHFPDAYLGKNVHLRDTLNNLILSSPQDWQTTTALPWMKIEGVTVAWDEVHFDVRLLQRVPYEGASRMQTSMRRSHRDRVVRRGIALIVESDFYRTCAPPPSSAQRPPIVRPSTPPARVRPDRRSLASHRRAGRPAASTSPTRSHRSGTASKKLQTMTCSSRTSPVH